MKILRGIAVSPGVALGPLSVQDASGLSLPARSIPAAVLSAELNRLGQAIQAARSSAEADLREAQDRVGPQCAEILAVHARLITDPSLLRDANQLVSSRLISAEYAVIEILEGHANRLESLADPFLAGRAADMRDILNKILRQLVGERSASPGQERQSPGVLVAHDIPPSQAARLDRNLTLAFATESGGKSSHTAIVAAALEIPAVVGLGPFLSHARLCQTALVDGDEGLLILDPDPETLERYRHTAAQRNARFANLVNQAALPAQTKDGVSISLLGNIEFPAEAAACRDRGADGVGLYRTEFLYLGANQAPTEEEQYQAYSSVVQAMDGKPVTIRTLDLGADRLVTYEKSPGFETRNPSLGLRSIRLSLRDLDLFRTQLRAILRASALGDVRVMFPLVTTMSELRRARALLSEVADDLRTEGVPLGPNPKVGAMIEVPAAAILAGHFAKEVDFLSIGTNDLVQYTLAVDRTNETVADLYNPADPAVLRLIAMVVDAARSQNIDLIVCGSMGGEPLYAALLLGLGIRRLSMAPHQLPEVKRVIRALDIAQVENLARIALNLDTAESITEFLKAELEKAFPDLGPAAALN